MTVLKPNFNKLSVIPSPTKLLTTVVASVDRRHNNGVATSHK